MKYLAALAVSKRRCNESVNIIHSDAVGRQKMPAAIPLWPFKVQSLNLRDSHFPLLVIDCILVLICSFQVLVESVRIRNRNLWMVTVFYCLAAFLDRNLMLEIGNAVICLAPTFILTTQPLQWLCCQKPRPRQAYAFKRVKCRMAASLELAASEKPIDSLRLPHCRLCPSYTESLPMPRREACRVAVLARSIASCWPTSKSKIRAHRYCIF